VKRDPLRTAYDHDPGTIRQAIRLLKWWADDESDEPEVIEAKKQSIEVVRSLRRIDRAGRRPRV